MPAPTAQARRLLAFAVLLAAVAWLHQQGMAALSGWLARPTARTAARPAALPLWLLAVGQPPAAPPAPAPALPPAATSPRAATASARLRRPAPGKPAAVPPLTTATRPATPVADGRDSAPPPNPPPDADVRMPPQVAALAASAPQAAPAPPDPPTDDAGPLAQRPVYPTRPPPSALLHFAVRRGEAEGHGQWLWQADAGRYSSHLQADLAGRPALDHLSRGGFDAAGLAPERMVEQQRQRPVRAVNFQRDKGLVSFSGSARQWGLHPGTQDRASWLPQLLAVVAAHRTAWRPGDTVSLAVAGSRGDLDDWRFVLADAAPHSSGTEDADAALHWVREPRRPYDSRVEVWLTQAAPHWPLRLQWQVLPGGDVVLWQRLGLAAAAPP